MKVTPISFNGTNIVAIDEGRKTQTRRIAKEFAGRDDLDAILRRFPDQNGCPFGEPGDLLYVKEDAFMWCERRPNGTTPTGRPKWLYVPMRDAPIHYAADGPKPTTSIVSPDTGNAWGWRHKVARFMPRWASRTTLRLTAVRIERLQKITERDAVAEGCGSPVTRDCKVPKFIRLWESLHGLSSWPENPHVWVLTFKPIKANVDDVIARGLS
ncbi:hypothetical protein [Nevskia sp.]|uniref:hypothetical protein n=1 Tax=Nevskia sp. TaxID=1929292 RepID=UPI0025DC2259|nr:hypothetical protein [Nevskia sp.]